MDTGQYAVFVFCFGLQNPFVNKPVLFQAAVSFPTISRYGAARSDVGNCERNQFFCTASGYDLHSKAAKFMAFTLNCYGNSAFMVSSAASLATMFSAKIKLIGLNIAGKLLAGWQYGATTELLQPLSSGAIAAQAKKIL